MHTAVAQVSAGVVQSNDEILLCLVRHGESTWNKWRRESFTKLRIRDWMVYDPGIRDPPLTSKGKEDAQLARSTLEAAASHLNFSFDLVCTSPLTRALQTADQIFRSAKTSAGVSGQLQTNTSGKEGVRAASDSAEGGDGGLLAVAAEGCDADGEGVNAKGCEMRSPTQKVLHDGGRVVVVPCLREWRDTLSDVGLPTGVLAEQYLWVDFADDAAADQGENLKRHLSRDGWWWEEGVLPNAKAWPRQVTPEARESVRRRVAEFVKFLLTIEHRRNTICVIGHSWYFREWTGLPKMRNGECLFFRVRRSDLERWLSAAEGQWTFLVDIAVDYWTAGQ